MLKGFKDFIMRGNVVDLAIAVILGGAFAKVVEGFVAILMNLIGKAGGTPNFNSWNPGGIPVGPFLTSLVYFLIVAAILYFLVVTPMNRVAARRKAGVEESKAPSEEAAVLMEIRDELRIRRL
ncbi:large conductance mechanosensitive channel protein MscL [Arsenicicoccus dermatophilus]|uniref:large conductance mechanosensitive channel protein MscL n=1 Tax=Arsenicicoccus dermatophilus TaxID=1076331 RepID=UPI001F4CC9C5|nr:large conductance mechanosensitive channel protein MscL [Arsenicicoccus dermatophilus]MCH8612082.1 large conductance mechanosensitive channel protein MscL [Arsenicicoccus dermatophilus]